MGFTDWEMASLIIGGAIMILAGLTAGAFSHMNRETIEKIQVPGIFIFLVLFFGVIEHGLGIADLLLDALER